MIQSTRPKLNRFKYAAMLLGAMAVAATPLAYPAIATAERVWDIEDYDDCITAWFDDQMELQHRRSEARQQGCCVTAAVCLSMTDISVSVWLRPLNRPRAHGSFRATFKSHPTSPPHPQ